MILKRIGNASRMGRIVIRRFLLFDRRYRQPFSKSSSERKGWDLEEDNKDDLPTTLTYDAFEGGSKRSRHSAPKEISEEAWANMSRKQRNEWRTLHLKTVPETKKARTDNAFSAESEAGTANITAGTFRPSNWDTLTKSQKSMWRRRNK